MHRLLLVGNAEEHHVGAHLLRAGQEFALPVELVDVRQASRGRWADSVSWRLRDRRPAGMGAFGEEVVAACRRFRPTCLISTGMAPLDWSTLDAIGKLGVKRLNYSTDDPWNPAQRSKWFLNALTGYDAVFSTRRSNLEQLRRAGVGAVHYLPFGYDPTLHFSERAASAVEHEKLSSDVLFVGGADADRVPFAQALVAAGLRVALYGGYWQQYRWAQAAARGHADLRTLRHAVAAAKLVLCLVRRANRDGHVMRTFETAASGACMLVEDTAEHREIFGVNPQTVAFFATREELVDRARHLLFSVPERRRLADAVRSQLLASGNTYCHRLKKMLRHSDANG